MEQEMGHVCCCNIKPDDKKESELGTDERLDSLLNELDETGNNSSWIWVLMILFIIFFSKPTTGNAQNLHEIPIIDKLLFHISEANIRFK